MPARKYFTCAGFLQLLVVGSLAGPASAEPTKPGPGDIVFEFITAHTPPGEGQLINGKSVKNQSLDWPSVLVTPLKDDQPDGTVAWAKCTATLVGPGVMILAAHCLDRRTDSSSRGVFIQVAPELALPMDCELDPAYRKPPADPHLGAPRRSSDFALCYLDPQTYPSLASMVNETVDTAVIIPKASVLMMGFGCTDIERPEDQDKVLRVGDAKIESAPTGQGLEANYALIVSHGPPEPALCKGDSGGALVTGATVDAPNGARRVRGVNSSIEEVPEGYLSRIAMLSDPTFTPWAKAFAHRRSTFICGLDKELPGRQCHA